MSCALARSIVENFPSALGRTTVSWERFLRNVIQVFWRHVLKWFVQKSHMTSYNWRSE